MASRVYLYALHDRLICPGSRQDYEFDYERQTIGETADHIPLPWLAMFRVGDLVTDSLSHATTGALVTELAPITTRGAAKANLEAAGQVLSMRFPLLPMSTVRGYLQIMARELDLFPLPFVTLEWSELSEPALSAELSQCLRDALRGFEGLPAAPAHVPTFWESFVAGLKGHRRPRDPWLAAIKRFDAIDWRRPLPDADALLKRRSLSPRERESFFHLLPGGVSHRSAWQPRVDGLAGEEPPGRAGG